MAGAADNCFDTASPVSMSAHKAAPALRCQASIRTPEPCCLLRNSDSAERCPGNFCNTVTPPVKSLDQP